MSDLYAFLADHVRLALATALSAVSLLSGSAIVLAEGDKGTPLVAALAGLAGAAIAYFGATRKYSGHISTSDAADLWEAAEQIRKELRDECERLRQRVRELEARLTELEGTT